MMTALLGREVSQRAQHLGQKKLCPQQLRVRGRRGAARRRKKGRRMRGLRCLLMAPRL